MPHVLHSPFLGAGDRKFYLTLSGSTSTFLRSDGTEATPSSSPGAADPVDYQRRSWTHQSDLDGVAYVTVNIDFTAFTGTGSSSSDDDSDARWIRNTSGALSGNTAQLQAITSNKHRRDWKCHHAAHIKTGSVTTSTRFWCGYFSAAPEASDDPSAHLAAFRYSTGAADTDWMCCVKDGTTLNATASGVAFSADTRYFLRVETDSSEVRFYINAALVHTATANLPTGSTNMGPHIGVTTLTNAARFYRYARQYGSQIG